MTKPILEASGFAASILDALSSHICVIDNDGVIVAVNRAWQDFTEENPPVSTHAGVGAQYLDVCRSASGPDSEDAAKFALGVQSVLQGKAASFEMEYSCHSPTQNRWFSGDVTPLENERGGAVISHTTITDRKLLELELARLAEMDSLTGLPNRRYFLETASMEVERVRRFGTAASLVMIDLDHFKAVNDTYGHPVGDEALRCLTQVCEKLLRQIDVIARIGGEEFAVMLPGTDEAGAVSVAEKLRHAVCETPVKSGQNQFNITASFGAAEVRASDTGIDECLARADSALYAAKHAGRNRVMSFAAATSFSEAQLALPG
jgi:diguanylate cyclase (GGDEF)-like protein